MRLILLRCNFFTFQKIWIETRNLRNYWKFQERGQLLFKNNKNLYQYLMPNAAKGKVKIAKATGLNSLFSKSEKTISDIFILIIIRVKNNNGVNKINITFSDLVNDELFRYKM